MRNLTNQSAKSSFIILISGLLSILLVTLQPSLSVFSISALQRNDAGLFPAPLVSTRGNYDNVTGELNPGHSSTDYSATNIPGLEIGPCPPELMVFVHGAWVNNGKLFKTSFENASEIFDRVRLSLEKNNYTYPLAGFSWDSNTSIIQPKTNGWVAVELIAKENGPKLAQFILDFMNKCADQGSKVRLIAHSLGARVVLSALDSLDKNQQWNNNHFKIASVHLLGAAVDDEEIAKNPSYLVNRPPLNPSTVHPPLDPNVLKNLTESYNVYGIKSSYGKAIETQVIKFYNLFDSNDLTLINLYFNAELDNALGLTGAQKGIPLPSNYNETDVKNMIPPFCDANGDHIADPPFVPNKPVNIGNNHAGYYGFRNATNNNRLIDDGVMNTVVKAWNSTLATEKKELPSSAICHGTLPKLGKLPSTILFFD